MELKEIKELIKFIDKSDVTEFELENEGERIYISKHQETVYAAPPAAPAAPVAPAAPAAAPAPEAPAEAASPAATGNQSEIASPIVGTFYEASSPGSEPFVKEGDTVKKGQTLCIIEAMKIMNEIEAEFDCRIVRKVGENAKPVEYGETIFIVEPA
ncbi:acetyl-CoA carboxylase biotin carboxyl carrier protein [Limisalsivibrio acetivorans]|uniref:acetyl-CoA carboxylase biotin carboxyl carrier protein n=1 Tax=Limisalsivibrio acetivorans TaxID=1304888 RepID=UPI0003B35130|nr:acetyl-CoA carboxylase biotin carboxyl carrier protein [Limisalsivibrio acetivorans]